MHELHEKRESYWVLISGPLIWAGHFVVIYAVAAIWCAKVAGRDGSLDGARVAIAILTALALAGIAIPLRTGWKAHRYQGGEQPHDADTALDRHRLLGMATFLLAALSAIAVLFESLAIFFFESCN